MVKWAKQLAKIDIFTLTEHSLIPEMKCFEGVRHHPYELSDSTSKSSRMSRIPCAKSILHSKRNKRSHVIVAFVYFWTDWLPIFHSAESLPTTWWQAKSGRNEPQRCPMCIGWQYSTFFCQLIKSPIFSQMSAQQHSSRRQGIRLSGFKKLLREEPVAIHELIKSSS
jgi:hypothetical protein